MPNSTPQDETWTAPDGTRLGCRRWLPTGPIRARVIALHGLGCWAGDFDPLAAELVRRGITLEAWNLRGQGLDPETERRGAWLEVEGHLNDLARFSEGSPNVPTFLCSDSMGALLAIQEAARAGADDRWRGLILFVPVVALAQENPAWVRAALRSAATLAPALRLRPGWFVHGKAGIPPLSRIPERQRALEVAPHRLGPLTLGFLARMGALIEAANPAAPRITLPVAVVAAGHDVFVRLEQTRDFVTRLGSADKTCLAYPESFHQVLFDLDAPQVVADVADWIERRIPPAVS